MQENISSQVRRVVVVSFDHWHLGYLGCYGNDWIETPHLDRLASEAIVFDRHYCDNIDPQAANHSWWTGRCQFSLSHRAQRESPAWCAVLQQQNIHTHLIIESDGRDDVSIAPPFDTVSSIRGVDGFEVDEAETPIAKTVQEATRVLQEPGFAERPALLWIKSRGVPSPWTPPPAFADLYLEEFGLAEHQSDQTLAADGDPSADPDSDLENSAAVREADSANEADESSAAERKSEQSTVDESLDWRYAGAMYAAYVTLVDRWVGKLLKQIDESPAWRDALLIVTAGCGQALGEHGRLADDKTPLRAESIHTPLWIRLPECDQGGTRRQALVQTIDIGPTIIDWFGLPESAAMNRHESPQCCGQSLLPIIRNEQVSIRDSAWMGNGRSEWGVRTAEFQYAEPGDEQDHPDAAAVLFEKPHDRWDQFNVASQFRQVVDDFHELLKTIPPSSL